jgi:biopolymer transport protein ExbD
MADIAFLLLIFFLVTTTMDVDTGIARKLPPLPEEEIEQDDSQIKAKNIYIVLINSQNQLLVEGEYIDISELRAGAKTFINNKGRDPESSDSPQKAIISLQNDRGTSYETYIKVQNELAAAYRELRDNRSLVKFGKKYSDLNKCFFFFFINEYPQKISEAEPKNIGG